MGAKLLSLQMIPWCFHLMGGTTTCDNDPDPPSTTLASSKAATTSTGDGGGGGGAPSPGSIKLIRTDGRVEVYHRPVSASELMSEHPRHLVCRSDAPFTIGQMIPSLPEGEQLQPGHAYFLLPVHVFHSVLSFVTLASSFARAVAAASAGNGGGGSPPSALLQKPPFDVEKTPSGKLQIRVSDAFIERIREAQDGGGGDGGCAGRVCTTAALEKDYRQLVAESRARQWKPRLETITESAEVGRGRLVAVAAAAAAAAAAIALDGIRWRRKASRGRRRRRSQDQQQQQEDREEQQKHQEKLSVIAHYLNSRTHKHVGMKKVMVACNFVDRQKGGKNEGKMLLGSS